jgi:hypothetical protein
VIVFLGPGKAERKPPHLFSVHRPHVTLLGHDRAGSMVVVRRLAPGTRVSSSHTRRRRRRLGAALMSAWGSDQPVGRSDVGVLRVRRAALTADSGLRWIRRCRFCLPDQWPRIT